jgi:DNA-binding winged helix-turn-helix (wHTH) protein
VLTLRETLVCYRKMPLVIDGRSDSQILMGRGGLPIAAVSVVIAKDRSLGLKSKTGGQAATKDGAVMEPATEARNVISFGPFSLDANRRLLVEDGAELRARIFDVLIKLVCCPNGVVSDNDQLALICPRVTAEGGSLRFHIVDLRKSLRDGKDGARCIATLKGRGCGFLAGDRVEETVAAAHFPHADPPARLIGLF